VTWISGNAVAPDASCDHAGPPNAHSSSDAEPEGSNDRLMGGDIVLILKPVSNYPDRIGRAEAAICEIIKQRCQETGGARG
jgi:hypothetical protein